MRRPRREGVIDALVAYNDLFAPKENYREIESYIRNEAGEVIGGVLVYTHWGWLFVKQLWVAESARGMGAGTRLMKIIESNAWDRGCKPVWLDTFDFQALPFYTKLGYEVFTTLDDFPVNHKRIFLKKKLSVGQ